MSGLARELRMNRGILCCFQCRRKRKDTMRASSKLDLPDESHHRSGSHPSAKTPIRSTRAGRPGALRRVGPQLIIRDERLDGESQISAASLDLARRTTGSHADVLSLPAMLNHEPAIERSLAPADPTTGITQLLADLRSGRREAFDQILPLVYHELRRAARRELAARPSDSLSTTALVHELYLKFSRAERTDWRNRAHFLGVASVAMRHILVDRARRRKAEKRGGPHRHVTLEDDLMAAVDNQAESLLELHEALDQLAKLDERLARVVECRFFGGMTEQETAEALHIAVRTVRRDWIKARGLLYHALGNHTTHDSARTA
jgi:RNA polymerase sigma factor (TIGR02999 family)